MWSVGGSQPHVEGWIGGRRRRRRRRRESLIRAIAADRPSTATPTSRTPARDRVVSYADLADAPRGLGAHVLDAAGVPPAPPCCSTSTTRSTSAACYLGVIAAGPVRRPDRPGHARRRVRPRAQHAAPGRGHRRRTARRRRDPPPRRRAPDRRAQPSRAGRPAAEPGGCGCARPARPASRRSSN